MRWLFHILLFAFFLNSVIFQSFAQKNKSTVGFEICLITYNEFNEKGEEQTIVTLAWLKEIPDIPVYTYFDHDAGKKVNIRTKISPYKGGVLATADSIGIIASDYGIIEGKCKSSEKLFELIDLKKIHPDFVGESLALEIKFDGAEKNVIIISYPFENDFPFKFAEDVVYTKIKLEELIQNCWNSGN